MNRLTKIVITLTIILASTTLVYSMAFPQPVRCMLIDFYDFEKTGNLYYRSGLEEDKKQEIFSLIDKAEDRVDSFWNGKYSNPTFIYCETDEDYLKFGAPYRTPAVAILTVKSFVVISKDGVDLDILSHELSHTELAARIGFIDRQMKIPAWFDEGLAMQVDHRSYYSLDSLKKKSNGFQNLVDVTTYSTYSQFGSGTREEVMLNYSIAKYQVSKWYSPDVLASFIHRINEGKTFEQSYSSLE